ncbi:MAG: glutathione synthase [Proteobacteria bacterium]|nr:glutathione synthase [Pseudomonadota bacterium]
MTYHIGVLMDPIATINPKKDSTLAMLQAAQKRGWQISVFTLSDLTKTAAGVSIRHQLIQVHDDLKQWFSVIAEQTSAASVFDAILMRKDPPFDMEYIYATYLLDFIEKSGTPVLNRPGSIRDCNEKLFALQFPDCCPPHIVTRDMAALKAFHAEHGDVIYKPLDGMGGASIFRATATEHNLSVIVETLTQHGTVQTMAQRYIPEIVNGDTRILLINGEPVPYGLARVPLAGETRGNLAAGGSGVGRELTERDRFICDQVGPVLREKGLYFTGIDVIGDYLTEINVTCPTCIRELDAAFDLDIAGDYMQFIESEILQG